MSYRTIFRLLTFLLSLMVGLLVVACEQKPEQYLLLFEQRTEDMYEIYTVQPDGSELTKRLEFELGKPQWLSPDGRHIALFDSEPGAGLMVPGSVNGSLTIVDMASGGIIEQIEEVGETQTEHLPISDEVIWSPRGDKLFFIRDSANVEGTDIWLYDLNAKRLSQLTADNSLKWAPTWSPDEKQIAFVRREVCGQSVRDCPPEERFWDLVIMDDDGSNQRIITNFQDSELFLSEIAQSTLLCDLSWSPDGQYIVMRNQVCGWYPGLKYGGLAFLVKTDGSYVQRLTDFIEEVETDDALLSPEKITIYTFDWFNSNNNLFIGYTTTLIGPPPTSFQGFLIVDTNDFSYVSFRETFATAGAFATWSPDKEYVIGSVEEFDESASVRQLEIILASWDGNQGAVLPITSQLPRGSYNERKLFWSPDSQYVAYAMTESQRDDFMTETNETERGIAVVSLPDEQVTNVIESLPGNSRPIGWISSADAEP
jgi:Tol biopolymer transport system component